MRSKIEIELKANGTLLDITQGEDKIFQGAVGVTEYHLSVADGITGDYNWRPTDIVYMSLKRNDGQTAQVKMTAENGGWVWTSNGWETDVDISGTGNLELSFICKRYSIVSVGTVAFEKTTEKIDLIVYESAGYVSQNIDIEIAEELQEAINALQLDKVGRYSVSEENLPYLPAEIVYDIDGAKTPNNIYFNFTHNIIDFDDETYEKTGAIFVMQNGTTQNELFLTSDNRQFVRISGENFIPATKEDLETFTYDKAVLDGKFDLKQDKADNDLNTTDKTVVGAVNELKDNIDNGLGDGFVKLNTNQTIEDTKTFINSPVIPDPTANTHAVNRESMQNYTYSKSETNNITQGMTVDTYAHFLEWIAGIYTDVTPAGTTPADFIIGKKVYITEPDQSNYRCINTPITSISDFEVLAEDVKALQEITATPYKTLTATNGQAFVDKMKDEYDLKTQTTEEADLTILTTDWVEDSGNIYYDYTNANYTNLTNQRFEFISNDKTQNEAIIADKFQIISTDTIVVGSDLIVRLYANKVPSLDLTFKVLLSTYTDTLFEAGEIPAHLITYDNTISGLTATNIKTAIDELESKKIDKTLSIITSNPQYAVMLQSNGNPKMMPNASVGKVVMAGQTPKNAIFDGGGRLGSMHAPTDTTDFTNKNYVDNLINNTTSIYIDGNRTDIYTETGSITFPFKTLASAIIYAHTLTSVTGFAFYLSQATYTINAGITLPDKPIVVYGNNAIINNSGYTITIPNPYFVRYNLFTTSNVVYSTFVAGARSLVFGGGITGNITNNSYVEFTECQLNGGVVTTGATGQTVCVLMSPTSKFVSDGVLILDKVNINTNYVGYLVLSTAGQLTITNSIIYNGSTNALAGGVSCNNGATTTPNLIANNALTTAGSAYGLFAGTAYTVYSKNYIVATNTVIGSALLPVNTDITGGGNVMALGSDATGDMYYRNSSGILTRLPIGLEGQIIDVDNGIPRWRNKQLLYKHKIVISKSSGIDDIWIFTTLYIASNTELTTISDIIDYIDDGATMASGSYVVSDVSTSTVRPITHIVKQSGVLYAGLRAGYTTTGTNFTFESSASLLNLTDFSVSDTVSQLSII